MSDEPASRPANLPDDARWEPGKQPGFEWKQGAVDADGKRDGLYRSWTRDGVLHAETLWDHGKRHGPNKNFHPDGSVSSIGDWRDDVLYDCVYYRSAAPSTEPWPGDAGKAVRSVGFYSQDGTSNYTIRYFDAAGTEVAMTGEPLPARPAGVPDTARWFPDRREWVDGCMARANNKQVGRWRWWSGDGWLRHEELRDDMGGALETIDYHANGTRSERKSSVDGGQLEESFFDDGKPKWQSRRDAQRRERFRARWSEDGSILFENTIDYDGADLVRVVERGQGGALAFEARREGDALACVLYDGGTIAASGLVRGGKLAGTWRVFAGGELRREVDMTPIGAIQKPTGEGLLWRIGHALYDLDEPGFATPDVLAGVDDVAWDELETAYGNASGFPRFLRGALAPDPLVRMVALGLISREIAHQGSTYPATAGVIPWFARLLAHPAADRSAMLRMIHGAATNALPYLDEVDDDDVAIAGTVAAVRDAWPQIWALFPSADDADRRRILAIAKAAPASAANLRELARSDAPAELRACALDSLASHDGYDVADVLPSLADDDPLIRIAAALAIGRSKGPDSPREVVAAIAEAIRGWRELADRWDALPYTQGHLLAYAAQVAGAIRTPEACALTPALCASIDSVDGVSAVSLGDGLLAVAFGRGEGPFAGDFADILDAITRSRRFWVFNVNAAEVLGNYGLPRDAKALEALVAEVRAAGDPEALLRERAGIRKPGDVAEDEADDEEPEPEAPPDPALDALARFAEAEHVPELCARPDAAGHARELIEAARPENRQAAAQHVLEAAGEALGYAIEARPDEVHHEVATIALALMETARPYDRRAEWSRVWPISSTHAEPALFALAAGQWDKAEALAREQLRDPRSAMADNHAMQAWFARLSAGLPPPGDIPLADPRYETRTYNRIWYWFARQPVATVERILDALPPEARLEILIDTSRARALERVSRPLARVVDAMEQLLTRLAAGILPPIVGGATSPLSDLVYPDAALRWFLKKHAVDTDDDRRLVARGWHLYSYLVCASQMFFSDRHVREAIDEATRLGHPDADWLTRAQRALDRDALEPADRDELARVLPRIAGCGTIVGRSVGGFAKTLTERGKQRLFEVALEVAPALAWPVVAVMADGATRVRESALATACPDVTGGFHALELLGAGEILARLVREAKARGDVAGLVANAKGWLHVLAIYGDRLLPDRIVDYGEALLARDDVVAWLAANEPDHEVFRGYAIARQPMAAIFAWLANYATHKATAAAAVELCRVGLRFPRGRGAPARQLLALVGKGVALDDALAATAGPFAMDPEAHLARARLLAGANRRDEAAAEVRLALAAGACPVRVEAERLA